MKKASQTAVHGRVVRQVALVCLLLITGFTFAEATHLHSIASPRSEERCDFCLAVHASTAAVPVASATAIVLHLVPTQVLRTEDCKATSFFCGSDLSIRPPPLV